MSQLAIINLSSGSVPRSAADQLSERLDQLGYNYDIQTIEGVGLQQVLGKVCRATQDPVIVWGGDGTLAFALETLGSSGPAVLGLPGGTMNMLHKTIHGDVVDWRDCLTTQTLNSKPHDVAAGCVNGKKFYVAAMLGKLTGLARPREDLRDGEFIGAARAIVQSDALNVNAALSYSDDTSAETAEATSIGLFVDHGARPVIFEMGAIDPHSVLELAQMSVSAILDDWRTTMGVDRRRSQSVTVRSLSGEPIEATLDGEIETLPAEVQFTVDSRAGRVISAIVE